MTLYEIRIRGHLDSRWEAVFTGFNIKHQLSPEGQPITDMVGRVADQSALYGIISQLQNMGIGLISVQPQQSPVADHSGCDEMQRSST